MDANVIKELQNGLNAAYINGSVAVNLAYKPAFVSKLQIAFTSNLGTNAGVMAANGLGYPVSIEGSFFGRKK